MCVKELVMSWAHQKAIAWIVRGIFGLLRNPAVRLQIKPLSKTYISHSEVLVQPSSTYERCLSPTHHIAVLQDIWIVFAADDISTNSTKDVARINSGSE